VVDGDFPVAAVGAVCRRCCVTVPMAPVPGPKKKKKKTKGPRGQFVLPSGVGEQVRWLRRHRRSRTMFERVSMPMVTVWTISSASCARSWPLLRARRCIQHFGRPLSTDVASPQGLRCIRWRERLALGAASVGEPSFNPAATAVRDFFRAQCDAPPIGCHGGNENCHSSAMT